MLRKQITNETIPVNHSNNIFC